MGRNMLQIRCQMLVSFVFIISTLTAQGRRAEVDSSQLASSLGLPHRLKTGDRLQCDGKNWIIGKTLGSGAQGKVFAVTEAGTSGPVRAMKMDLSPDAAYHARTRSSRHTPLETGMPHADIPECGILEALESKGVSAVPHCFAGCSPDGYKTAIMTAVLDGKLLYSREWLKLKYDQKRSVAYANVKHLFELVQAEINPSDTEAYLDRQKKLMVIDWGGAFEATYQSSAKWKNTDFEILFRSGLPRVQGMGTIAPDLCKMDDALKEVRQLNRFIKEAFCREQRGREEWVAVIVRGGIQKSYDDCEEIPSLECPR